MAIWILVFLVGGGGNMPMQSKDACLKAMSILAGITACVDTSTGQIYKEALRR